MSWFAVGSAAVTVVTSATSASSAAGASAKQSIAQNEASIKANIRNTIRTGYRMGLANMQRGLQKRQAVQQGYEITAAGQSAMGAATANAAAAGSVGSSVDAVSTDISMKVGEALVANKEQNLIDAQNYNTQLQGIAFEGLDAVQSETKTDIPSTGDIWGGALLAGASSFASSYFGGKMKLGLGNTTPSVNPLSLSSGGPTVASSGMFNLGDWRG